MFRRKRMVVGSVGCLVVLALADFANSEVPLGTAFTYQGQLKHNGAVVTDTCDFEFTLWDNAAVGKQIGTADTQAGVDVRDGLFTVLLDFGGTAFDGDARWLAMTVKCSADAVLSLLSPRQPIAPTPYALQTRGIFVDDVGNVGMGTTNPAAKLDVSGNIKLSDSATDCDDTTEGSLRYNSITKNMEYCNGTVWNGVGGSNVPPGTVTFFDPTPCSSCSCAAGWTEVTAARGRYLVGVPEGGTVAGSRGTPLTDLETRSHDHAVDIWASDLTGTILNYMNPPGEVHTVITTLLDPGSKWMSWHNTLTYASHDMKGKRETTTSVDHTGPYLQLLVCRKN